MERTVEKYLEEVRSAMMPTALLLQRVAADFSEAVDTGLQGRHSSLQMLPTYVGKASGRERGDFVALDFGGTNVRVARVALQGAGKYQISTLRKAPLKASDGSYDYTQNVDVEELFGFLASQVVQVVDDESRLLGHSFSFASRQVSLGRAYLIGWTKEIKVSGVEGQDVGQLLTKTLRALGKENVQPVAVINDTTATFLATSYAFPETVLGSVCGTGHNTCLWNDGRVCGAAMAFNTEAGGFDRLPFTHWDDAVDRDSENPGRQRLEKMVAGRYVGEVVRQVLGGTSVTTFEMADWLGDKHSLRVGTPGHRLARDVSAMVIHRAASLVGATYHGMLLRIDPRQTRAHVIGMNGSLYEKMPGFADGIQRTLLQSCGWATGQVRLQTVPEAPLVGAAIAAAYAENDSGRG